MAKIIENSKRFSIILPILSKNLNFDDDIEPRRGGKGGGNFSKRCHLFKEEEEQKQEQGKKKKDGDGRETAQYLFTTFV